MNANYSTRRVQSQSIPKRPSDLFPVPLYSRSMAVRIAAAELLLAIRENM